MIGDDALRNLARRKAADTPRRQRTIIVTIAAPTGLIVAAATLIGLAIDDANPIAQLWVALPNPSVVIVWAFIFGFLFLISVAAFAVSDQETISDLRLLQTNGASADQLRRFMRFSSMIPGSHGILVGAAAGLAVGMAISAVLGAGQLKPLHAVTVPVGAAIPALIAWAGVAVGARWPRQQATHDQHGARHGAGTDGPGARSQPTAATGSRGGGGQATGPTIAGFPRRGLFVTVAGLISILAGAAMFNSWPAFRYSGAEPLGLSLLTIGTPAFIAGLVILLPSVFELISRSVRRGPGWLRYALTDLGRDAGRSGKAAGAVLVLAILTTMAAAGIESDSETRGGSGTQLDARYIVTATARPSVLDDIRAVLDNAPEIESYTSTRIATVQLQLSDRPGFGWVATAAVLDEALIDGLGLTTADIEAANSGSVLLNSGLNDYQHFDDDVTVHRIWHGEGAHTPLAVLVGPDHWPSSLSGRYTLFITATEMSDQTRDQLIDVSRIRGDSIDVRHTGFAPTANQVQGVITAAASVLAILATVSTSALAALAARPTLAILGDLGLGLRTRRLVGGTQAGLLQLVAGVCGSVLGVLLFWLVTRGDPSVPDPIVPWIPVIAFTLVVPVVTMLLVGLVRPNSDQPTAAPTVFTS